LAYSRRRIASEVLFSILYSESLQSAKQLAQIGASQPLDKSLIYRTILHERIV